MADLTLNALKKAPILDESDTQLSANTHSVTSSNLAAATVASGGAGSPLFLIGVAAGLTDVTVQRLLDNVVVVHSVEVIAADPFDWHLGPEVAA